VHAFVLLKGSVVLLEVILVVLPAFLAGDYWLVEFPLETAIPHGAAACVLGEPEVSSEIHRSHPSQERTLPSQLILHMRKPLCHTEICLLHSAVMGVVQGWWHDRSQPGEKGWVQPYFPLPCGGSVDLRSQPGLQLRCKGQAASVHPLSDVGSSRDRLCWRAHLQLMSVRSFSQREH